MQARHGSLVTNTVERDLEAANGRVLLRLARRDGGYVQEFHAIGTDRRYHLVLTSLHRNLLLASQHRECLSPMIAGERSHLFGACEKSTRFCKALVNVVLVQIDSRILHKNKTLRTLSYRFRHVIVNNKCL